MDNGTTNSSESFEKSDWCLICCSAHQKLNTSTNNSNCLTKATEKIFQFLLVPTEQFQYVKKKTKLLSFCPNCMLIVEEIIGLQKKAEVLELQIRWKVETLGRIAIDTPANSGSDQKQVAEVWKTFKAPVTENFLKGLLPNPSVNLGKVVNTDEISPTFQKSKIFKSTVNYENNETESKVNVYLDDIKSSDCTIVDQDVKTEADESMGHGGTGNEIIPKKSLETNEYDSNDDLPEMNQRQHPLHFGSTPPPPKRQKYDDVPTGLANVSHSVTTTRRHVLNTQDYYQVKKQVEGVDYIKCTQCNYRATKSTSSKRNSLSKLRDLVAYHYSNFHNPVNPTVKGGKCWYSCTDCTFSITCPEDTLTARRSCKRKLSLHYMKVHDIVENSSNSGTDEDDFNTPTIRLPHSADLAKIPKELKGLIQGQDYIKCTRCDYFEKKSPTSSRVQNFPNKLRDRVADHYSRCHNLINPTDKIKTNDGKYCYRCKKCHFSVVIHSDNSSARQYYRRKLSIHYMEVHDALLGPFDFKSDQKSTRPATASLENAHNPPDPEEEIDLDELIEGRDYAKCNKCDYYVTKTSSNTTTEFSPAQLRQRVVSHYSSHHNPVKTIDLSKTIEGKDCYKCTKCTFTIVFQPTNSRKRYNFLNKLSLHYIELHDVFESQQNSNTATATSFIEGIDYFLCPIANCAFVAFIKKGETPKHQFRNASEARLKVIKHYKTSQIHYKDRTDILSPVANPCVVFETKDVGYFNCTKCVFKSFVNRPGNFTENAIDHCEKARNTLQDHFLFEHVFPWEKFPGLYKFGCYEEDSENGQFLRCFYSNCDYYIKIQYDIEARNPEQSRQEAYQSFKNHVLNYNLNSIGLDNNNEFPATSAGKEVNVLQPKQKLECNDRFQISDVTTNPQFNEIVYDEVTVKHEIWSGDYEEVEEIPPTIFDISESIA